MATTSIHSISTTIVRALAYISNLNKTKDGMLVQTYACSRNPDEAEKDFLNVRNSIGTGRGKTLAQHMIISFKPDEITPEKAFEFGNELCCRLLKDQYQYMLAVHTDKKHIHCHIIFNNINMENGKTFSYLEDRGKKKSWKALRKISDEICKENGLSVVQDPDKNKGKSWYEWDKNRQGQSWKTKLKFALDECVMSSSNFEDFLRQVRDKGIEVSYNPEHKINLKFRMQGQEKWSRAKTLGWYYETPQIKKRIDNYKLLKSGQFSKRQRTKIIDTSAEKFQSSKGLERWANIRNMKEASRVINILTNLGIQSISEIEDRSVLGFNQRMNLVNDLNTAQHNIDTLSDTIRNVRTFKKYKPVHDEYKAQKSERQKKKYAEKYAPDLEKFKSASAYLKVYYPNGKVPSEEKLTNQRTELIEERKQLNEKFKTICGQLKDLDFARQTIEDYLNNERGEQKRNKKKDDLE